MGEPARGGADGPRPEHPAAARLDPRKRIWADVQETIITCAHVAALAVTELASRPDDDAAVQMAALSLGAFERAVEIGRQWVLDEVVLNEQYATGYREGYKACKEQRCRLEVVDGG
jgi:predicted pyridoxine 5'-phosphate oxidase superfamily flavin-nucleotide-binding protein